MNLTLLTSIIDCPSYLVASGRFEKAAIRTIAELLLLFQTFQMPLDMKGSQSNKNQKECERKKTMNECFEQIQKLLDLFKTLPEQSDHDRASGKW
jgi:hypothetical protein